jgi:glycerophosphoryl diester phosphodiesterase
LRWATPTLEWRPDFAGEGCCVDITHAGGLLNDEAYTHSLVALNQNYHVGRQIFEIDLALTADDHIVLAHD